MTRASVVITCKNNNKKLIPTEYDTDKHCQHDHIQTPYRPIPRFDTLTLKRGSKIQDSLVYTFT